MTIKPSTRPTLSRCYCITAAILLIGFGSAVAIYLSSEEISDNPFADYEQSKRFSHEVQRMGGKMALVANDLSAWFASLWQGQQLAYTVACFTVVIAVGYYVIASGTNPGDKNSGPHDNEHQ